MKIFMDSIDKYVKNVDTDSQLHPDRLDPISSKSPQHCFTFVPYCLNHFFDEKGIIFGHQNSGFGSQQKCLIRIRIK